MRFWLFAFLVLTAAAFVALSLTHGQERPILTGPAPATGLLPSTPPTPATNVQAAETASPGVPNPTTVAPAVTAPRCLLHLNGGATQRLLLRRPRPAVLVLHNLRRCRLPIR